MMLAKIVWGSPEWVVPILALAGIAAAVVVWAYARAATGIWVRLVAAALKLTGIFLLAMCLIEPLFSGVRPRPGANLFIVVADNSHSLQVRDRGEGKTRGEILAGTLQSESDWQTRLGQDFDLRRYVFDTRLHPVAEFAGMAFDGEGSALSGSLASLARRFRGRPNAGVLLFSDGNATDWDDEAIDVSVLPPVYAVIQGTDDTARDISVQRVSVSQTNFEAAPVTVLVEVMCHDVGGQSVVLQLLDEAGKELQRQLFKEIDESRPLIHRFQLRPEEPGVGFYRVRALMVDEEDVFEDPSNSSEATLDNNTRWITVDRGQGPFRVLYVTGRPNWDFKFLRRALQEDDEVNLVGLVRIAKREPKFTFRGHLKESTNPLFRGFDNQEDEEAEQYDQPVLLRLGTEDEEELLDGFPKAADQLYRYNAVILDDVEAGYFTHDQMSLIQQFVSQRGGGFLMLGGRETFAGGDYEHSPISELLPVYVKSTKPAPTEQTFRMQLTRDGWLQPWVRLRDTETEENQRLSELTSFRVLNRVDHVKPGATVLATVLDRAGKSHPALVGQRFGRGRAAALLIGDMWRANLRRPTVEPESDLEKAWRQMVRWLVADVPGRVGVEVRRQGGAANGPMDVRVSVRDASFRPLDNAAAEIHIQTPDGEPIDITADPAEDLVGTYHATFMPRTPGPYRATVVANSADASRIGERHTGWTSDPAVEEFQTLRPNRRRLEQLAERTGGEVIEADRLHAFVKSLPNRKIPVTEPWIYPLWHQWPVILLALMCLIAEWGLRRWKGLP